MRRTCEGRWDKDAGISRRAQEVVELVLKGLLNEMGVEYPRTHDPAPVLVEIIRQRRLQTDPAFLDWLSGLSNRLAEIRGPAFYHEIEVDETEARSVAQAAERVLVFGRAFLGQLGGAR